MRNRLYLVLNFISGLVSVFLFPKQRSFDFSKITPEKLYTILPKSKDIRGATALVDPSKIAVAVSYRNSTSRALVWNIKYKRDRYAIACAGYILYHVLYDLVEKLPESESCLRPFIIIPMPISGTRRRERGYNQCELLATAILRHDGGGIFEVSTDILVKVKHVEKQTFKNRRERLAALADTEGIFETIQNDLGKKRLLFVLDDVITTGSTLQAAMDCLHRAGFENVRGIALAH